MPRATRKGNNGRDLFIRTSLRLLNDLLFAAIIVMVLIWANPVSGLAVAAVITIFAFMIFQFVRPELVRIAAVKRRSILKANRISIEAILGVKEVKMAGAEDSFAGLFDEQVALYAQGDAKGQQWAQIPRIVLEIIAYGALVGICAYVILFEIRSAELSGLLLLYGLSALRLMPIFSTVVAGLATLLGVFPIIGDIEDLIAATKTTETAPPDGWVGSPWREIRLDKVSLDYQGAGRTAVRDVSLTIERGKSYGAVGPSGADLLGQRVMDLEDQEGRVVGVSGVRRQVDHRELSLACSDQIDGGLQGGNCSGLPLFGHFGGGSL